MTQENMYYSGEKGIVEYAQSSAYATHDIIKSNASSLSRTFVDYDTNISVLSGYSRTDYEWFRQGETIPRKAQQIMVMANEVYKKVGIVTNVIDIMGDFGCQGVRLQHPNPQIENFYNKWFQIVNGPILSERFLNLFYRLGVVMIRKAFGKIGVKNQRDWNKAYGEEEIELEKLRTNRRRIPLRYSFLNPLTVEIVGGQLSSFTGKTVYALRIPQSIKTELSRINQLAGTHRQQVYKSMLDSLPKEVKEAIQKNQKSVLLDPDLLEVFHHRKDDWELWGRPITYSIFNNLMMLEKLQLADASALDGAISHIRLWRLGIIGDTPQTTILPNRAAIEKLKNILANASGGGSKDLVWGPELDFKESQTQVHRFLGMQKYEPHLNAIYDGLGVPPALRSGGGSSSGNGSFMALKTMVERLEYGRRALTAFWKKEIEIVQKAMGFRFPAQIVFDQMILSDEAAEKALLVQLADRDIISYESLLERFDIIPEIENVRVKREYRRRDKDVPKASPFHNPQTEHELKKIILQNGGVAPSQIGLELEPIKEGEEPVVDKQMKMQKEMKEMEGQQRLDLAKTKPQGSVSDGRPKNVTETKKRKPKPKDSIRTSSFVEKFMWANSALKQISDYITPGLLKAYGKKNLRSLTAEEVEESEYIKFGVLCCMEPFEEITEKSINEYLQKNNPINDVIKSISNSLMSKFVSKNGRKPTMEEFRQIQSSTFALVYEEEDNGPSDNDV